MLNIQQITSINQQYLFYLLLIPLSPWLSGPPGYPDLEFFEFLPLIPDPGYPDFGFCLKK